MCTVDLYLRVWLACHVEGLSQRGAASRFGIVRETVKKMLRHSEPPSCRRWQPPKRPKLVLEEGRTVHRKQRHTAKQIFERLRDEMVLGLRSGTAPSFPGDDVAMAHAQADFGEADAFIAGVKRRAHFSHGPSPQRRLLHPGGGGGSLAGWPQQHLRLFQRRAHKSCTKKGREKRAKNGLQIGHLPAISWGKNRREYPDGWKGGLRQGEGRYFDRGLASAVTSIRGMAGCLLPILIIRAMFVRFKLPITHPKWVLFGEGNFAGYPRWRPIVDPLSDQEIFSAMIV